MAVAPASAVVSTRRGASGLPGSRTRRPAARTERCGGLDRSADPGAAKRGPWARPARRRARHAPTRRPPGASRMSRLHRQPRSRNARTEFPQYRAEQGPWSRRRDARTTTKAGLRRPSRAGRAWLLHAYSTHAGALPLRTSTGSLVHGRLSPGVRLSREVSVTSS